MTEHQPAGDEQAESDDVQVDGPQEHEDAHADLEAALGFPAELSLPSEQEPSPFFGDDDDDADAPAPSPEAPALAPGEPGTAGAVLADLAAGADDAVFGAVDAAGAGAYSPYYPDPGEGWSTDRLESIMRDTIDAQAQEQKQLEQLMRDVRAALTSLPEAGAVAETSAGQAVVAEQIQRLVAELTAARAEQAQRFSTLGARVDEIAAAAAGPSIQDLHDGLAGVRTDMTSLPEQLGPAVTSAVAQGIAGTSAQVGSMQQALNDTVAETTQLRSLIAQHSAHVALLPEAVSGLRDLTERVGSLEAAATSAVQAPAPLVGPELSAVVDERLTQHLDAFGAAIGQQLASLGQRLDALQAAVEAGADSGPEAGELDARFGALHDELRTLRLAAEGPSSAETTFVASLHASEQRLAHHVDEAVLALAQAVLRRRAVTPPTYAGTSPLVPGSERPPAYAEPAAAVFSPQPIAPPAAAEDEPDPEPEPAEHDLHDLHDDLTDATAGLLPARELAAAEADAAAAQPAAPSDDDVSAGEPGPVEAWAKGDPAPPEGDVETRSAGWPPAPVWPSDVPSTDDAGAPPAPAPDGDTHLVPMPPSSMPGLPPTPPGDDDPEAMMPSPDVLPGRHRPGGGEKRGLFRRKG